MKVLLIGSSQAPGLVFFWSATLIYFRQGSRGLLPMLNPLSQMSKGGAAIAELKLRASMAGIVTTLLGRYPVFGNLDPQA